MTVVDLGRIATSASVALALATIVAAAVATGPGPGTVQQRGPHEGHGEHGEYRQRSWAGTLSRRCLDACVAASVIALVALAIAFARSDYSLVIVVDHSRSGLSTLGRIMGLWGGMAGSLLLFTVIVLVVGRAGIGRRPSSTATATVAAVGGSFLAIGMLWADPWRTLDIPAITGGGLTPILEHWAMRIHPPITYIGLAATIVPFAHALENLRPARIGDRTRSDAENLRPVSSGGRTPADADLDLRNLRPMSTGGRTPTDGDFGGGWGDRARSWLLVSWTFLAAGMILGSVWAYGELGWGGYWAWDPVENTALLPWLAVTLALHARLLARSQRWPSLDALPFVVMLIGTTLTRSGVTQSVHSFAEDAAIGRSLLLLSTLATIVAVPAIWRRRSVAAQSAERRDRRAAGLLINNALLVGALVAVGLGTLFPAVEFLLRGDRRTVDGRWFSTITLPISIVAAATIVVCLTPIRRGEVALEEGRRLWPLGTPAAVGASAAAALLLVGWRAPSALVLGGVATALAASSILALRRHGFRTGHLAHLGLAVLLFGIAATSTGASATATVSVGSTERLAGVDVTVRSITVEPGPAPDSSAVVVAVDVDGHRLRPSLVAHPNRSVLLAENAMWHRLLDDVQVVVRDADDERALLQVNRAPLQSLVWFGGVILVVAGLLALGRRSDRPVGAPPERVDAAASGRA